MPQIKDDAQFFETGRQSAPPSVGDQTGTSRRKRTEVAATRAAQVPSDAERQEGLPPDELNSANDK